MTKGKTSKTEKQKQDQKTRTAHNKIKKYEKALKTAKGSSRDIILKKMEYYKERLTKQ